MFWDLSRFYEFSTMLWFDTQILITVGIYIGCVNLGNGGRMSLKNLLLQLMIVSGKSTQIVGVVFGDSKKRERFYFKVI